ncbi:hypothetical protein YC2023_066158 [Brassica napus]
MVKWRCRPELVQIHGFRSVKVLLDTPPENPKNCPGAKGGSIQISLSRPVSFFMVKQRLCPRQDQSSPLQSSRPLGFGQVALGKDDRIAWCWTLGPPMWIFMPFVDALPNHGVGLDGQTCSCLIVGGPVGLSSPTLGVGRPSVMFLFDCWPVGRPMLRTVRGRSDTVLVSTINDANQGSADVAFRTPLAPYEKSKFLGSRGSIVARLKLKGIDGRAPPRMEPAA